MRDFYYSHIELAQQAKECLENGGVILLPTDTVYGLAVHPERDDAAERLFALKRRPRSRNLPIMVASMTDLDQLGVEITDSARKLMDAFSPGPLSLALGLRSGAAPGWLNGRVEVAVRIPAEELMLAILAATGPLLVTSANAHAQDTPESVEAIVEMLASEPDLVIDGGVRKMVPSTLVNCNLPEPIVERVGVIAREEIEQVLR